MGCIENYIKSKLESKGLKVEIEGNKIHIEFYKRRDGGIRKSHTYSQIKAFKETLDEGLMADKFGETFSFIEDPTAERVTLVMDENNAPLEMALRIKAGVEEFSILDNTYNKPFKNPTEYLKLKSKLSKMKRTNISEFTHNALVTYKNAELRSVNQHLYLANTAVKQSEKTGVNLEHNRNYANYLYNQRNRLQVEIKDLVSNQALSLEQEVERDLNLLKQQFLQILHSEQGDVYNELHKLKEKAEWYEDFLKSPLGEISELTNEQIEDIKNKEALKLADVSGTSDDILKGDMVQKIEDRGKITELIYQVSGYYQRVLTKEVNRLLNNSKEVKEILENIAKEEEEKASKKLNYKPRVATVDSLLIANKDINVFDKNWLGVASSHTGDTIIPQMIQDEMIKYKSRYENMSISVINKFESFLKRHPNTDLSEMIAHNSRGNKSVWLTHVFSGEWFNLLKEKTKLTQEYYKVVNHSMNNKGMDLDLVVDEKTGQSKKVNHTYAAYSKVIEWHKKNTDIVDFTMLPEVYEQYKDVEEFKEYFTSTEQEREAYANSLKKRLGREYNVMLEKTLNHLLSYSLTMSDDTLKDNYKLSKNIWKFMKVYNRQKWVGLLNNGPDVQAYFTDFKALPVIPKESNPSHYSEQYKNYSNEQKELLDIMYDMSDFINEAYGDKYGGRVMYPKIKQELGDNVLDMFSEVKSGESKGFASILFSMTDYFKDMFYDGTVNNEGGTEVIENKVDNSESYLKELKRMYLNKGFSEIEAQELAEEDIIKTYSTNMEKAFKAAVLSAGVHRARVEVRPIALNLLERYKMVKDRDDRERKNGIARLTYFVEKVVLNISHTENQTTSIFGASFSREGILQDLLKHMHPKNKHLIPRKAFINMNEQDKLIYDELEKMKSLEYKGGETSDYIKGEGKYFFSLDEQGQYWVWDKTWKRATPVSKERFHEVYVEYLEAKMKAIGIAASVASIIDGILQLKIMQSLYLNYPAGIVNRVEGALTIMIQDQTGEFWKPGNARTAKEMLAYANTVNNAWSKKMFYKSENKHIQNIQIFSQVLERLGGLQDKRDALKKTNEVNKLPSSQALNGFALSIDNAEFKNQGSIALAIMMDYEVTDNNGNVVPFLDKETQTFNALELNEDGELVVKAEFSESFKFDSDLMGKMTSHIHNARLHSQGDYSPVSSLLSSKYVMGRAVNALKRWAPEHWYQRFGTTTTGDDEYNINYSMRKSKHEGRFTAAFKSNPVTATALMGIGIAAVSSVPMIGLFVGGATVTGLVYHFATKGIIKDADYSSLGKQLKVLGESLLQLSASFVNVAPHLLSSIPGFSKLEIKKDFFSEDTKSTLTDAELGALRGVIFEIAVVLNSTAALFLLGLIGWDDEDDDKSPKRKLIKHLLNMNMRMGQSFSMYFDPVETWSDVTNFGLIKYIADLMEFSKALMNLDGDNMYDKGLKLTPVPNIVRGIMNGNMPWENEYLITDFSKDKDVNYSWVVNKSIELVTDDEKVYKKRVNRMRRKEREDIRENLMGLSYKKDILKVLTDNIILGGYGEKSKREDYVAYYTRLSEGTQNLPKEQKLKLDLTSKLLRLRKNKPELFHETKYRQEIDHMVKERFRKYPIKKEAKHEGGVINTVKSWF